MINVPETVAIILDGNRRYARVRGKDPNSGHKAGAEKLIGLAESFYDIGVKNLILYAFSTENFNRPKEEVDGIMREIWRGLDRLANSEAQKYSCRIRVIGDMELLERRGYKNVVDKIIEAEEKTEMFSERLIAFAIAYGGRNEIINAVKNIARSVENRDMRIDDIDEETFKRYLYTSDIPDPDVIIRTSGEQRISNFLLWQGAYSEFYSIPLMLPEVTKLDVLQMLFRMRKRERRYGR